MLALCHWIDNNAFFMAFNSSSVMSVIIEVTHYFSMMMVVGCMAMVDLRILGLAGKSQNLTNMAQELLPWVWIGLFINTISGFLLFTGEATAYYRSGPFQIKVLLVV